MTRAAACRRAAVVGVAWAALAASACGESSFAGDGGPDSGPDAGVFTYEIVFEGRHGCVEWPRLPHPHPTLDPLPAGGPFVIWEYDPATDPRVVRPAFPMETSISGLSIGPEGELWAVALSWGEVLGIGREGESFYYQAFFDQNAHTNLAQVTAVAPNGTMFFTSHGVLENLIYYIEGRSTLSPVVSSRVLQGPQPMAGGYVLARTPLSDGTYVGLCRGTHEDWSIHAEANGEPVFLGLQPAADGTFWASGPHLPGVLHLSSTGEILGMIGMSGPVPERNVESGLSRSGDVFMMAGTPPPGSDYIRRIFHGETLAWTVTGDYVEGRAPAFALDAQGGVWSAFLWDPPASFFRRYSRDGTILWSQPTPTCDVNGVTSLPTADGGFVCIRLEGPTRTGWLVRLSPDDGSVLWELEPVTDEPAAILSVVGPDVDGRVYAVVNRASAAYPHIVAIQTDALPAPSW